MPSKDWQRHNTLVMLKRDRMTADQGDFFFARLLDARNRLIPRPVFVIGKHNDSNDSLDVIVCLCTTHPARSPYDVEVSLKHPTVVRSNKIFLVERSQLEFKISHQVSPASISLILDHAAKAIGKKKAASFQGSFPSL